MQRFRNFKDQIRNSHFQPQNSVVSIRRSSSSSSSSTENPPAKKERNMWNTSILVLSKHRRAILSFLIITIRRDKDWTSRSSPSRDCLPQTVLIRRRDVRLRKRKIGPYKYPTIKKIGEKKKKKTGETTEKRKHRREPIKKKHTRA